MLARGARLIGALIIAQALLELAGCSRPPALAGDGAVDAARDIPVAICPDPAGDEDKDGIPNAEEGCPSRDSDGDGIPDFQDFDSDDDGIYDDLEAGKKANNSCASTGGSWPCDSDGDGLPDYLDADSDGDGLADGDEDWNHDGRLGCCLASCDKPGVKQSECSLSADGCGTGQSCVNGSCSPTLGFECSQGETDPTKKDTFGDGKLDSTRGTAICRTGPPLQWPKSATGDWSLALDPTATYGEVAISNAGPKEAAATIDLGAQVAGFVVSRDTTIDDVQDEHAVILQAIAGLGSVTPRTSGVLAKSHDMYDAVQGTLLELALPKPADLSGVRNALLATLLGKSIVELGNLAGPLGTGEAALLLRLITIKRFDFRKDSQGNLLDADGNRVADSGKPPADSGDKTKWRLLVMAALAPAASYDDPKGTIFAAVDDLANGTGLAASDMNHWCECEGHTPSQASTVIPLDLSPISASLAVSLDATPLPRSRAVGFDYDAATRSLVLSGISLAPGSHLLVSYRWWTNIWMIPPPWC